MSETLRAAEKEPARWELYTGDEKDIRDLRALEDLFDDETDFKKSQLTSGNGLILRRGKESLGFVSWRIQQKSSESTMYIERLYISKKVRSAGITAKFVQTLKAEAERAGVKKIQWHPKSSKMWSLSNKIGAERKPILAREIPIEKLDIENLFEKEGDKNHG